MGLVRIHCYGCANTVAVADGDMSRGVLDAGWAVHAGQTFCPSCASERGLDATGDDAASADPAPGQVDGAPEHAGVMPEHAGVSTGHSDGPRPVTSRAEPASALVPFDYSSAMREPRSQRAWRLLRASFGVLREDPQLLVFPAVSMALTLILGALSFFLSVGHTGASPGGSRNVSGVIFFASLVSAYPITFVSLYCGVALAAVLAGRLDGRPMTPHDGWMAARERIGIIAAWTLLVCTVGAALRLIERYLPLGAKIVAAFVDLSWTLATMFAVPVLAYENLGPVDVLRRSSQIFRQRWGTQIGGIVGISVASVFLYIPFVVLLVAGIATHGALGALMAILGGAGLFAAIAAQVAMDQIFRVFVYRSAVGLDTTAGPFSQSDLQAPFARRRGR